MKMIDPTYLRFVCDELYSGKLDRNNLNSLPNGVSSFFDRLFYQDVSIIERRYVLDNFICMALLRMGVSLNYLSILTATKKKEWNQFIQAYSQYFNVDSQGNYRLFHDRLIVYLFQRSNDVSIRTNAQKILKSIYLIDNEKWVAENKGYFLYLNEEIENLFRHISLHRNHQFKAWWISDLERLLDMLYNKNQIVGVDFTVLCELLRACFDFVVQRKGVRIIAANAHSIDWDLLESFFDTTRFQYELATEFSKHPQKLPENWNDIFLNEDHPCSYMFSYVWKYSNFNIGNNVDQALIERVWLEGSPYQRIIVIMIWGYQRLNDNNIDWLNDLITLENDWQYLKDEKDIWISFSEDKDSARFKEEFESIKNNLDERYHYIFDRYWSLFDESDKLNQDVRYLWKSPYALDIALWIYKHPVWEIGKIANEIVINRLRVKSWRHETINWLLDKWETEEFYALGEVIFELKAYLDIQDFLTLVKKVSYSSSCQVRGAFISDLVVYLEGLQDMEFSAVISEEILPHIVVNASDIWEVQEILRLLKFFMDSAVLSNSQITEYLNKMELTRDISDPIAMDYNQFWKQSEINKGIMR